MKNIKLLRTQHHMSQQQLADKLQVSQQSIHKYENDITTPDIETLKLMAQFFDTTIDYIVELTDVPYKSEPRTETSLNESEIVLVESFRRMSPVQRNSIQKIINEIINLQK